MQTGEGSVKVERSEPKGNLDGFLARLHASEQNEGHQTDFGEPVRDKQLIWANRP